MMTVVTDQEEEEQWCLGRSQPPKEYITFSYSLIKKLKFYPCVIIDC